MKSDNASSHISLKYDSEISKTIPYYHAIHNEILNFIKAYNDRPGKWLDAGCGTGTFGVKILEEFKIDELILSDPSDEMLSLAKSKITQSHVTFINSGTSFLRLIGNSLDAVTAIQSHHYLSKADRKTATEKCFNFLKSGGIFITFENTRPLSDESIAITKNYWKMFQISQGKSIEQAEAHLDRFDKEYHPITVDEHIRMYHEVGFSVVDLFWKSYMQAGFYCIKK